MTSLVTINQVIEGDYQDWLVMWNDFQKGSPLSDNPVETMWQRYLDPNFPMWSVLARSQTDGSAVGLATYTVHLHTDHIEGSCCLLDLYVAANARKQGIGNSLIETVKTHANDLNCMSLFWITGKDNTEAQSLYNRLADKSKMITYEMQLNNS